MSIATKKKRGRKRGSGATISADELFAFWLKFQAARSRAIEMQREGSTDKQIEWHMAPLAFEAMDLLIGKAEALRAVKQCRQRQVDRDAPDVMEKVKAGQLDISPAGLRARRKNQRN
jgi:hypothetical protein